MTWSAIRPWLGTLARLVLGVVWIYAAVQKVGDPRAFTQAVRAYQATPEWLSKAIGYGLPILELAIGLLLVLGVVTRVAAAVSGVLLLVFLVGIIQAAARGLKLECGCFGGGGQTNQTHYTLDILRDLGLLVLVAYLLVWSLTRFSIDEALARNDYVPPPSAKRMRTAEGQRRYNAVVEARRREARSRTIYLTAAISAVVVLIAVIGIGVQAGRAKISADTTATNASVASGVVVGKATAKAKVDIYEDFQCPVCNQFQQQVGSDLDADISAGRVQARFHMMAFLDSSSNGNNYSTRAANAALCASDISVDEFLKYHDYLYGSDKSGKAIQPAEGSNGRTDADLVSYGRAIGITGTQLSTFQTCVQTEQHKGLVQAITDQASKDGVNATPTIKVNGKALSSNTKAAFDAAVTAVAGPPAPASASPPASGSPSGSASPSASGSASVSPSP